MTEKENILKEVLWLGIELIENDLDEAESTIKNIRKYIKEAKK